MALPTGPTYPAALQMLFFLAMPEASLKRNTRRYGHLYTRRSPIFGDEVMVSDPEVIKQILTGDPGVFYGGEFNDAASVIVGRRSLLLLDGAAHLRERRRMTPPFHGERMHGYAVAMRDAAVQGISAWREGDALSLLSPMQRITMEIILGTVFGLSDGRRRDALRDEVTAMVEMIQSPLGIVLTAPAMQRDLGPLTPWAAFVKVRARVDALIYAQIEEGRAALASPGGERREDVLSMLLAARDEEGQGMTDEELRDELMTLLLAGYETTAMALCWAFEQILSHPAVEARILEEVGAAPPESPEQLGRLEYLDAAIKESLRVRPVVPSFARKTKAKVVLGGYEIPAETLVNPVVYATHRRADLYPEPEAFRPERFLGKKPDPYAWLPFGGGARRCLGMAFALYEMKIVVATVLSRVRMRLEKRAPLRAVLRSFFFSPEGGARVVIEGRRPSGGA